MEVRGRQYIGNDRGPLKGMIGFLKGGIGPYIELYIGLYVPFPGSPIYGLIKEYGSNQENALIKGCRYPQGSTWGSPIL